MFDVYLTFSYKPFKNVRSWIFPLLPPTPTVIITFAQQDDFQWMDLW